MFSAFLQGWKTGFRTWRVGLIVYALQFLLALILGMLVYSELQNSIGNSLELKKLLLDYDHTVITDLKNSHGDFMRIFTGGLPWLILIWFIFSIFITGGILFTIEKKEPTWDIFWAGGARYFYPFLKIGLFFLLLIGIISALIWAPLISNWESFVRSLPSEREFILILIGVFVVYILLMLFLFAWTTASKFFYLKRNLTIWSTLKTGFHFTRKNFFSVEALLLLFVIVQVAVMAIYWLVEGSSGMVSSTLIFVFFFIQQMLIFFRIIWRISTYAAINELIEWRDNWYRELID